MSAPIHRIQSAAAARILGVSQRAVQGLALRGELPGAARVGGVWTFDAGKLAAFLEHQERDRSATGENLPVRHPAPRLPRQSQVSAVYAKLKAQAKQPLRAH
jgi:hypothetical protein